jgi:uncharacterized protein (TIGR02453 family)
LQDDEGVMTLTTGFAGFPRECVEFYIQLAQNNNKAWFDKHKKDYEKYVMDPARSFVFEMGVLLSSISPKVTADPRVNRSIFRTYRDTRFSKDKTPYKTHLGIFFWEGNLAKMDCPGFYFHLEPPTLLLAAGNHCFSSKLLETYRDSVADAKHGPALVKAIEKLIATDGYSIGGRHYKKIPRGYKADGLAGELLLHNGLYAAYEVGIPEKLYSAKILEYCFTIFKDMAPIHKWLVAMTERAGRDLW